MGIDVSLTGEDGEGGDKRIAHVHRKGHHAGLVVLADSLFDPTPLAGAKPFLNSTFGAEMAQTAGFSGTPQIIHNGETSTEWTASVVQGTWDFSTGGVITQAGANNNDECTFAEETPTTIDLGSHVALTGVINLTTYSAVTNELTVVFDLAGTQVGDSVPLNSFFDTSLVGTAQAFVVPLTEFNLPTNTIDGFSIIVTRNGGTKPVFTLDDIQLEVAGDSLPYTLSSVEGEQFRIGALRIMIVDGLAGTVTDGTMPGLAYNQLLAVAALSNGIIFRHVVDGKLNFSLVFRQLSDFLRSGFDVVTSISDGTNTCIILEAKLINEIFLEGPGASNFLEFTINDDLSNLITMTVVVRGSVF